LRRAFRTKWKALDKTIGISSSSLIFAAVEVAVDDAAELAREIASQKTSLQDDIKILRSGGTWPGPYVMTDKASRDIFWLKDERETGRKLRP
jgi:predicted TIM-barrel enzyme